MTTFNPQIGNGSSDPFEKQDKQTKIQIDVSQRALAIARTIDRLEAGSYIIELEKVNDKSANWDVTVSGIIRVKEFKAYEPKVYNPPIVTDELNHPVFFPPPLDIDTSE